MGKKFGHQILNDGFSRNTHIFFYFFLTVFSETGTKNGGIHILIKATTPQKKTPVSMNTTTGFKFLSPNQYVNITIFCPSFAEYRQEKIKKYVRVSTETII